MRIVAELVNGVPVETELGLISARILDHREAYRLSMRRFEETERSIFAGLGGKYVQTGALMASLTESTASGAVRALEPRAARFGSSVPEAVFQGTEGPGKHRGPSAVLRVTPEEAERTADTILEFIVFGATR